MATGDEHTRLRLSRVFSEEQTHSVLSEIGVDVIAETESEWMCLCPFHGNLNTPAFAVSKTEGVFYCFNEACGASGDMLSLVKSVTRKSIFASERIIARARASGPVSVVSTLEKNMTENPLPTFPQSTLDKMKGLFWKSQEAQDYMHGRGFTHETLMHYSVGYSVKNKMVGVPMHNVMGDPIGLIGRSINSKRFKNSDDLPKKRSLWNIHRAKRNPQVVVTEASFDAMRVWQATGIESVACLGSSFSEHHATQLNKYFTHVVIMTDDDDKLTHRPNCRTCKADGYRECRGHNTGLVLGQQVASAAKGLVVTWAHLDSLKRYDGMKDAGDMTDDQIRYAVNNSISNFEMQRIIQSMV